MLVIRNSVPACFGILVLGISAGVTVNAQNIGNFAPTGSMISARNFHAATLLADGRVLITGGYQSPTLNVSQTLSSAEIYDPAAGGFSRTSDMTVSRSLHTATLLPDGRVLIAGGFTDRKVLTSAELYDPATGTFTAAPDMLNARASHYAVLLNNGKVLLLGGFDPSGQFIPPAEIFDPVMGKFSAAGSYIGAPWCDFCAPATMLADGRVLFTDQYSAQLYDPASNLFVSTGTPVFDDSSASVLADGHVLLSGGEGGAGRLDTAELYDPVAGKFASTGKMRYRRVFHTQTLLPSGMALLAGGETDACSDTRCTFDGSLSIAELYDPATRTFLEAGSTVAARETHTATLLNDGRVLLAGGLSYGGIGIFSGSMASAELYIPPAPSSAAALLSLSGDGMGPGAIQHATSYQTVSADSPATADEVLVLYATGFMDGADLPPQVSIGGRLAEVLWFGNTPGFTGLNQINVRVPGGIPSGPAVPVRITYIGRPSNTVTLVVQ